MTRPKPQVRALRAADHAQLRSLAGELMAGMAQWRPLEGRRAAVAAWVDGAIASARQDGHAVFVAVDAPAPGADTDRVRGFVSVATRQHFTGEREGYVGELVVDEAFRRCGVGRSLMAAAESWVCQQGLTRMSLETGSANVAARASYARLGYVEEQVTLTKGLG